MSTLEDTKSPVLASFSESVQSSDVVYSLVTQEELSSRAKSLASEFIRGGGTSYINEAIVLDREGLERCPPGHPERPRCLTRLATDLGCRYRQLGEMSDLDEAIAHNREALELRPQGRSSRSISLNGLAVCLATRYDQLGVMSDLDEALVLAREALHLRPEGRPGRSSSLIGLANYLSTRFERLGVITDLDEAIVLGQEALRLCPQGHPKRSWSLNNLANHLSTRYDHLKVTFDLDEAIVLHKEALELRPRGHLERSSSLSSLAIDLHTRYSRLGVMSDLEEAIVLAREALQLPQGHPDRSLSLSNLACHLFTRFERLGVMLDLDEAIVLHQEALCLRPQGHPERSISLYNLATALSTRYQQIWVMSDLEQAIILARETLHLRQQGHPGRSRSLNNLAGYLRDRFNHSGELRDMDELFTIYAELENIGQIVSSSDLSAARAWIRMAEDFQHPSLPRAYKTSLRLLIRHLAILPSSPQHMDVMKNLTSSLAVDAFAACLREQAPTLAVELLEQGRGVFWNQLARLRSPLCDVTATGPVGQKLADEFTRLALLIRNAMDSPGAGQHEELCHLNVQMESVVNNIRELPGLSGFLLPSLFSSLQRAASGGPVIIVNASKYGCDALVVLLDRDPIHIPLPINQQGARDLSTKLCTLAVHATRGNITKELVIFLREIWHQIVSPVVNFLRTTCPTKSRIWWCPTSEFSLLPLHAAGPFREQQKNLPDLYISSYTPTLTALIRARQHDPSNPVAGSKRFIAIGQAKAFGQGELPSVASELDAISQLVGDLAEFTRTEDEESCIPRVAEELGRNEWVHLACHGLPNREQPFESAFALSDGDFTIQRIIGSESKNSEFAYLSACHTTVGDEESPDESIHLASAMLFAGFRSVIGTMWAVEDGATKKITPVFYKHIVDESGHLDHTRAAYALNETMKSVNISLDQKVLYIHIGA